MDDVMYIRFGDLPASGRSRNQETDTDEAGVSVYRAEWQSTDRDVVCVYVPSDICVGTISQIEDRPVYIVTGRLLNEVGGDGEPLMADAVAELVGPVEAVNYVIDEE
jgi:hypothetical protein